MKVTRYEIDMLNVGAADAFLIHIFDDNTDYEYVVLIDGGNYEDVFLYNRIFALPNMPFYI
jgi:hypothetical protein